MRIYFDTEFTSLDGNFDWDLISAGFVTATGIEWYVEILDFNQDECSEFVLETVLPLLGQGDVVPEKMAGDHFGWRLAQWLQQFNEPIELVADAACDWSLVNGYAYLDFRALPFKVRGELWLPSERKSIKADLLEIETRFWQENPGMQHHALFDARRLKRIAERQAALFAARLY